VYTIVESAIFARKAGELLSEQSREALAAYLAEFPTAGAVISGSGGLRKLRWGSGHGGKRRGLRVIYINRLQQGQILLVAIFSKRRHENFSRKELIQFKKAFDDDN
jgi:hypothetical protein